MKLIGLAGKKNVGKDSVAQMFVKREQFKQVSFAEPLKELCSRVFKIDAQYFNDQKLKEDELPERIILDFHHFDKIRDIVENEWGFVISRDQREAIEAYHGDEIKTARHLMQFLGTDILRKHVRDDIFIVLFFSRVKEFGCDIVVSDVRLSNERKALKAAGAQLILIKRDFDSKDQHISENDLGKESEYDVVINNNDITLQALESEVMMWYAIKAKYR